MDKYAEIKRLFEGAADSERAAAMAKYMRNKFEFYGIPTPLRKALGRDLLKRERKTGVIDWDFSDMCYGDIHREFQYFTADYLSSMQEYLTFEDIPRIEGYIRSKQWWDTVDSFDRIAGDIGLRDPRVDGLMLRWSQDGDFWVRRAAIDHQLYRKKRTNRELLEQIILNNLGSREFFINKAIGWALRDYSKVDPEWVRGFIAGNSDRMDPLSVREGSKYI